MTQVAVNLNGREYLVTCDEGEQEHVLSLARYVDGKVAQLVAALGQVGDARLLAMASILVADELADARADLAGGTGASGVADGDLDAIVRRIEGIAARLESP
ncbi:MAG: cell division protein ZapA [Alphaproteobacteria bacterium]|nr:cell division protein ZapA [Alphaproteobacteria bacterium]